MKFSDTLITFFFWCHTGVLESDLLFASSICTFAGHATSCSTAWCISSCPSSGGCGFTSAHQRCIVFAAWVVEAAVSSGWGILSGGARGIDGAAHHERLCRRGTTVAVLGSGLSQLYPTDHTDLFRRIAEQDGCLLSEYEDHAPPRPWRFPQRNRLISGFSDAVFVVQAGEASGSLVTAKIAAEFHGKTVMALPGSACSPEWAGSNRLLRDGALLVNNQDDLLTVLALLQKSAEANAKQNEDDAGSVGKNG